MQFLKFMVQILTEEGNFLKCQIIFAILSLLVEKWNLVRRMVCVHVQVYILTLADIYFSVSPSEFYHKG